MRVLGLITGCLVAASLASCGGSSGAGQTAAALPEVHLRVISPTDSATTRGTSVTVRGTVEPSGATVTVLGQSAEVVGGSFTAQVDLQPGANVIDLAATAPRRGPALTAFRV